MQITKARPFRRLQRFIEVRRGCRRLLREQAILSQQERDLISRVNKTICLEDQMYLGHPEHYFRVGLSALRNINEAVSLWKPSGEIKTILDLPCGHGRVLRLLAKQFPNAQVYASDIDYEAVLFCEKAFGAQPLRSGTDFKTLSLGRTFDFIWCGSLITHLDVPAAVDLFEFFGRHLNPGGLLMLTSHGDYAVQRIVDEYKIYTMTATDAECIRKGYDTVGYGYAHYPGRTDYGIAACSPEWIRSRFQQMGGWKEVYVREQGWDGHQDVLGFSRQ